MPKYHKETKTIYQGKEMWVRVDPQALQETGEFMQLENLYLQMQALLNAIGTDLR